MVFGDKLRFIGVLRKVGRAEKAHAHGAAQTKEHPENGDAAGARNDLNGFCGHKAHENVRLPEVTQAPREKTHNPDKGLVRHHVEHVGVNGLNARHRCREPP